MLTGTHLIILNKRSQILNHVLMVALPQQVNLVDAVLTSFCILNLQDLIFLFFFQCKNQRNGIECGCDRRFNEHGSPVDAPSRPKAACLHNVTKYIVPARTLQTQKCAGVENYKKMFFRENGISHHSALCMTYLDLLQRYATLIEHADCNIDVRKRTLPDALLYMKGRKP